MNTVVKFLDNVIEDLDKSIFIANSDPCSTIPITLSFTPSEADKIKDALKSAKHNIIDAEISSSEIPPRAKDAEWKPLSPYSDTVEGMLSADYKERFKAEYQQTKIRYEKLNAFCNRIEAAMRTCPGDTKRVQMPEHDCPLDLLHDQLRAMGDYLHCLEIRAVIEGIEL